jgi:hypothetical protein
MASWNLYGKNVTVILDNGQHKILSGYNWYVASNQLNLISGASIVSDGPTIFTLAGAPIVSQFSYLTNASATFRFQVLDAPVAANTGDQLLIQIGRPQSLGTAFFSGPWQYVDVVDSYDSGSPVILDLSTAAAYLAGSSQKQWIRVTRQLPDGRYSTPVHYGPIVGSTAADPYLMAPNPLNVTIPMGGTAVSSATVGTVSTVTDLGSGQSGFSVAADHVGNGLIVSTTQAATGTYSTAVQIDGTLGVEYFDLSVTVRPNLYGFATLPAVASLAASATVDVASTIGTITSVVLQSGGGSDITYAPKSGGLGVTITTTSATPGVYPTVLTLGGSQGSQDLPVTITVT